MERQTTRRGFLRSVGATLAGTVLVACAPKPAAEPAGPGEAVQATVQQTAAQPAGQQEQTIQFLARGDDAIFKVFQDIKRAFEEENPGIKVTLDESPSDYYQKFQIQVAGGTPPDAIFEAVGTVGTSARKKLVLPLDDWLDSQSGYRKEDFFWTAFTCATFDGKLYGMPYDGGPYVLYWDKVLFDEAGVPPLDPTNRATWDEITEIAKELTLDMDGRHPNDPGFDPRRVKQYAFQPNVGRWYIYVYCNGGEVLDANGKLTLNTPEVIEALQWLADLGAKHYVAPSPTFEQSTPINFFSCNMAMQLQGAFDMVRQRQRENDWDIAPLAKGKAAVPSVLYSPLSLVTDGKNPEAAWKWVWYCCSEPGQTIVANLGQTVPAIRTVAEKMVADTSIKPENKQVFLGEFENVRLPGDKWGSLFGSYWTEWFQVWDPIFDPVYRGDKTAAEAIEEVVPKLDHLLKAGEVT